MMKALKVIWILPVISILAIILAGLVVVIIESKEPPLKPITEEWVLFVTKIEGEGIQVRIMEQDLEDFQTFIEYIGVLRAFYGTPPSQAEMDSFHILPRDTTGGGKK